MRNLDILLTLVKIVHSVRVQTGTKYQSTSDFSDDRTRQSVSGTAMLPQ